MSLAPRPGSQVPWALRRENQPVQITRKTWEQFNARLVEVEAQLAELLKKQAARDRRNARERENHVPVPTTEHVCPICDKPFTARPNAIYCGNTCRQAGWKRRQRNA